MTHVDNKQLEDILPLVSKPGRYLGNEWNVVKKDLDKVDVRFALAFPDIYDIGMSYIGLRIIYGILNNRNDTACERVFAPWIDLEGKLRERKIPLFSLESRVLVKDFDMIGFSLTYEMNYTNVLNMLDLAGIPLRSEERGKNFPLVIAGGSAASNPLPMSEFIDAFVIGEGEEVVLEIVDAYKKLKIQDPKIEKEKILEELAKLEGVYVPMFPKEVNKRVVADLDKAFYPTKELVPYVQIIHDRITLEIMRGCPFNCKFCQASSFYRPMRLRSRAEIVRLAKEIYRNTGHDEISLLSLSAGSYPDVVGLAHALIDEFKGLGVGISFPSLRSEEIIKDLPSLIALIRKTGLTFAPEAGSERLRKYINKNIDVEKIVLACDEAFKRGWRLVKFYFMIGLPTETYEDLEGISDFIHKILNLNRGAAISVSINAFVPKVHTPFENENMDDMGTLIEKQNFLKGRLKSGRIKLQFHDIRLSILEGKFSRPDKRLSKAIYAAWEGGAKFDSWREMFNFDIWLKAFEAVKL